MPELPEVEVTRRGIDGPLRGASVLAVRIGKPLRWPLGCAPAALVGRRIGPVVRRGKYLWLPLPAAALAAEPPAVIAGPPPGGERGGLLLHLGMSGSIAIAPVPPPPGPHDHFDLVTTHGTLRLTDPRRFGAVVWSPALDADPAARLLGVLGREPFDPALTAESFHAALQARRAPIKAVLLAGGIVVGAGNIYACEALHDAGIDPRQRADRISRPRAARLLESLRTTLARALDAGGTTLRNYRDAQGEAGTFQFEARVYGRAGLACLRCGTTVRRLVQGGRSTFLCPGCQRR